MVQLGHCGGWNHGADFIVAIPTQEYRGGQRCWQRIRASCKHPTLRAAPHHLRHPTRGSPNPLVFNDSHRSRPFHLRDGSGLVPKLQPIEHRPLPRGFHGPRTPRRRPNPRRPLGVRPPPPLKLVAWKIWPISLNLQSQDIPPARHASGGKPRSLPFLFEFHSSKPLS